MKKNTILSLVLCAAISCASFTALASDNTKDIAENSVKNEETILGTPQITVNGDKIDLGIYGLKQYMFDLNGNTMVPVRAVAEKMGYKVEWNEERESITVGDKDWEVLLNVGEDSYVGVSKTAIGMTAPQKYGAAPMIVDDTTFVPAKMFEILGYSYTVVGPYIDFTNNSSDHNAQIPNPFVEYKSIDDATKALFFNPVTPKYIPGDYKIDEITVMDNSLLQIIYTDGNNCIYYRTARKTGDISGDYNVYEVNEVKTINDIQVLFRGKRGKHSYSVFSQNGLLIDEMVKIIEEIKPVN